MKVVTSWLAFLSVALVGAQPPTADNTASGPVRMARISYAQGNVTWRKDDSSSWSKASVNLPIPQGAQIWVQNGGRAEVQFDDGSDLRLGNDAVVSLQSLYSDSQGEFTEIKLNAGTSSIRLKDKYSIYQIDTPYEAVKAAGPGHFRVDVDKNDVKVGVQTGAATISTSAGDTKLRSGDFVRTETSHDSIRVTDLPKVDAWDKFDTERDADISGGTDHLPPNVGLVSGNLDHYGHWKQDAVDGWVWVPDHQSANWKPYSDGNWVWCDPYGWTWCSNEPWGWAPYHYGTWDHFSYGWGWCPGPYNQYWNPACVDFTLFNGNYCWTPLCPWEVAYPDPFFCGFGFGSWWLNFSIGGCGVFRPGFGAFCQPIAFGRGRFDRGFGADRFGVGQGDRFVPRNAAFGATSVAAGEFGRGGLFNSINGNASHNFAEGSRVTATSHAFSGPVAAAVSRESATPSHAFTSSASPSALSRSLYRGSAASGIAAGRAGTATTRSSGFITKSLGASSVESARSSLGFQGRSSSAGDRSISSATASSRGFERTSAGSSAVERARQSLGYSGAGYASRSYSSTSQRSSFGSSSSSGSGGSRSYGGRYGGDAQTGSQRSTHSSSRSSGSNSASHGYSGGSSSSGGGHSSSSGGGGGGRSSGGGGGRGR